MFLFHLSVILGASPGGKSALEASMAATLAAINLPTPPPKQGMLCLMLIGYKS